jgi:hypothetical protein
MSWSFQRFALIASLGLSVALIIPQRGYAGGGVLTGGAAGGMPVLTVHSRHFQVQLPGAVTAGYVTLKYVNNGGVWSGAAFIRVKDGATASQVLDAYRTGDEAQIQRLSVSLGGIGGGPHGELISNLQPGNYVVGDTEETAKHTTIVAGQSFTVLPASGQVRPAPRETVSIHTVNFKFHMPSSVPAGRDTFKLVNMGSQPHEVILFRLALGKTVVDLVSALKTQKGPPPGTFAGGLFDIDPGQTSYFVQTVSSGNYVAVCFVTDPKTHLPHALLGMIMPFTVQ